MRKVQLTRVNEQHVASDKRQKLDSTQNRTKCTDNIIIYEPNTELNRPKGRLQFDGSLPHFLRKQTAPEDSFYCCRFVFAAFILFFPAGAVIPLFRGRPPNRVTKISRLDDGVNDPEGN